MAVPRLPSNLGHPYLGFQCSAAFVPFPATAALPEFVRQLPVGGQLGGRAVHVHRVRGTAVRQGAPGGVVQAGHDHGKGANTRVKLCTLLCAPGRAGCLATAPCSTHTLRATCCTPGLSVGWHIDRVRVPQVVLYGVFPAVLLGVVLAALRVHAKLRSAAKFRSVPPDAKLHRVHKFSSPGKCT